ncbi:bacillithiol system redox-active protein YtxJ [Formosa sp. A9]|uniref:bacillithiol system redox-active protein YtxJ n=1 Tax=Formosa sp. A9 TaxID=3442641 RepID=UPI003EC0353D
MGIFDKLFTNNTLKNEKALPWIPLVETEQLQQIKSDSYNKAQVIFKHSTRCGISSMVLRGFEKAYDLDTNVDLYFLDLLQYRDISNTVAAVFKVHHESPQLLIIKDGVTVAHASHSDINRLDLASF